MPIDLRLPLPQFTQSAVPHGYWRFLVMAVRPAYQLLVGGIIVLHGVVISQLLIAPCHALELTSLTVRRSRPDRRREGRRQRRTEQTGAEAGGRRLNWTGTGRDSGYDTCQLMARGGNQATLVLLLGRLLCRRGAIDGTGTSRQSVA